MAESSAPSGDRRGRPDRPRTAPTGAARGGGGRRQNDGNRTGSGRDGKPGERSERKSWEKRDGKPSERSERKPWEKRDGKPSERSERKPWEKRDGKPSERSERKPWEKRDGKPGEHSERAGRTDAKPWLDKDGKPLRKRAGAPRTDRAPGDRPREPRTVDDARPRHNDPIIPDSIKASDLDRAAYVELKGLSKENAERVAKHLVAAAVAMEADPQLAHAHALAAARTAGRIAVVRETVAITAYETGDYALGLRELRTYRRLSGSNDHVALIVDSERGLGRPEKALEEGRAVDRESIPVESRVALAIAMSGARLDLGQAELALGELEIPELQADRAFSYSPMLFHAYAEVLDELGRAQDSALWRHRADIAQAALDEAYGNDIVEVFEDIDDVVADVVAAAETDED